jgi:hypothetical protein
MSTDLAYSEWTGFLSGLRLGRKSLLKMPAAFQALWSHSDDVDLCGAFGGDEDAKRNGSAQLGQCEIFRWQAH